MAMGQGFCAELTALMPPAQWIPNITSVRSVGEVWAENPIREQPDSNRPGTVRPASIVQVCW